MKKTSPEDGETPKTNARAQALFLIHGDDDYLVTQEARRIIEALLPKGAAEFGLETVEGTAGNGDEATAVFAKLFESLQSRSFFAAEKVVWWRDTNLLGTDQTAMSKAVSEFLLHLNELFKKGLPAGVSLVATAADVDGRKAIVKTFDALGRVVVFKSDPFKPKETEARALEFAQETASKLGKRLEEDAALLLVEMADADSRTILSELEKLAAYVGEAEAIREEDVREVGSARPGGTIWELPDAVGERNLGKALAVFDNLIFMGEKPESLLFNIIPRIRLLFLLGVLVEKKALRLGGDFNSFASQMKQLPEWVSRNLPQDKKLNPLAGHPYVIWKASSGATRYTRAELQRALETLLECNEQMFSSGCSKVDVLKNALVRICAKG